MLLQDLTEDEEAGTAQVSALLDRAVLCDHHPARLLCHGVIHCLLISSATEQPKKSSLQKQFWLNKDAVENMAIHANKYHCYVFSE